MSAASGIEVGDRFGRLEVLHRLEKRLCYRAKTPEYACECNCGNITFVRCDSLKSGYTRSCGCLTAEHLDTIRPVARIPDCHPDRKHEAHGLCGNCYQRSRATYRDNYARNNLRRSLGKTGLTEIEYQEMLSSQEGRCAICREHPNGRGRLHIDHDHETSMTRGLLCTNCNPGIGFFRDSPELLRRAAEYLDGHIQPSTTSGQRH